MDNNRPLNDELFKNMKDASSYINKIYDKTSFADNYGSSIIIVVVLTIFVLSVFSYCLAMQKKEEIYKKYIFRETRNAFFIWSDRKATTDPSN